MISECTFTYKGTKTQSKIILKKSCRSSRIYCFQLWLDPGHMFCFSLSPDLSTQCWVSLSGRIDPVFTEWWCEVLYPIRYKPSRKFKAEIIIKVLQTISGPDGVTFASLRQSQVSGEWVLLIDNGVVVVSFQKHRLRWEWWWEGMSFQMKIVGFSQK